MAQVDPSLEAANAPTKGSGYAPGATVGRLYRVVRKLGEGSQGDVFEVEHVHLGTRFALKMLQAEHATKPAAVARFHREASLASKLNHPGIAAVNNFDNTEDGLPFAVMELLHGEDLSGVIARGPLRVRRAVEIAMDIASTMAAAHDGGVIHRDLKPANVFITEDGRTKVTDFGISRLVTVEDEPRLTRTGSVFGTPMYMAPEQAAGEDADQRADIYALGVMLYEMIAGQPPFAARSGRKLLVEKLMMDPPDVVNTLRGVPIRVLEIIDGAMKRDRAQRPSSMRDLVSALEAALEESGLNDTDVAETLSIDERRLEMIDDLITSPPPRSGGRGWLVAAAVGLGAIICVGAFALRARSQRTVPPTPVMLSTEPAGALVTSGLGTHVCRTPCEVTPGRRLRITMEGFADASVKVGKTDLLVPLQPVVAPPPPPPLKTPIAKPPRPKAKGKAGPQDNRGGRLPIEID